MDIAALTFTGLALMALAAFALAFAYAALTCSLTGADVADAGAYHDCMQRLLAAEEHADLDLPIQLPRLPAQRSLIAYRVPSIGARLQLTYIHAQGV